MMGRRRGSGRRSAGKSTPRTWLEAVRREIGPKPSPGPPRTLRQALARGRLTWQPELAYRRGKPQPRPWSVDVRMEAAQGRGRVTVAQCAAEVVTSGPDVLVCPSCSHSWLPGASVTTVTLSPRDAATVGEAADHASRRALDRLRQIP